MNKTKSLSIEPVCGETVEKATSVQSERNGKLYYFCCEVYRGGLLSNPRLIKSVTGSGVCC